MRHFELPLVAILRGITPDEVVDHAEILLAQGFKMLEVPTNSPDWAISITRLIDYCGDGALIGAGTVVTQPLLETLISIQGRLMVTPNTDPLLINKAKAAGIVTCIGALTPSEMFCALAAGADIIKLFPAANMGVSYVKAMRSVLPETQVLYAVGGITPENLADYLVAGCQGAGLGSDLYRKGQSITETEARAKAFVMAYKAHQKAHIIL